MVGKSTTPRKDLFCHAPQFPKLVGKFDALATEVYRRKPRQLSFFKAVQKYSDIGQISIWHMAIKKLCVQLLT